MQFLASIESTLPILFIIALGYGLRKKRWFADSFGGNLSRLILNIALPAGIFVSILKYLDRDKLFSLSDGLLYFALVTLLAYLIAFLLVKLLNVRRGRRGVFINVIANANTIFIGLPLNVALFGEGSLPYFLVCYLVNTLSTWTIGAWLIANDDPTLDPERRQGGFDWKKLITPPITGTLSAFVFLLADIPLPAFINSMLGYVGELVTPLALLYVGIMLADAGLKNMHIDKDVAGALIGRFIVVPTLMIGLITFGGGFLGALPSVEAQTLIVQSAVPALAVLPILAHAANGDVEYATNVVTISTLLFIIVIPIVNSLLLV
ncbi:malate permease [Chelonobacter oris]|uniref:AEC family transporter n=1 Tax=Chelonobacter oris TaxID=505317 RepID=UPI0024490DC2|nr:AEC family transporter [Chelonobacter oris]MDH2999380.1 malate permease [Chelonobacter oris]